MGHSFVRGNDAWGSRGDVWNYKAVIADPNLEGQFPMPESEITFAQMLQTTGYKTGIVGKWGLGGPLTNSTPLQKGFDFFFGYNCQRQAHTYYPIHLYKNDKRVYLDNDTVAPNTKLDKGADPLNPDSYKKYTLNEYSGDLMFDELTEFVNVNKDEPFFMYWATPIPHAPIQAPQRWVDYYIKKFGDEKPYIGNKGYFPHRNPHAGYAAMISYLDEQVGLLVKQLKDLGIYENTLIIFTSDNGPTYNGGTDSPWFDSGGPFKSEMGWGKGFTHEGGMRVPMIAAWPNKIKPGQVSDHISAFWDVLPTICDITGMETPDYADGISFLPELLGKHQKKSKYLYWEFPESGGQQAVRMGKWKAIRKNIKRGNMKIELYNLDKDIQELTDLADQNQALIKKIEKIMVKEHVTAEHKLYRMKALGD
jgi:arylsulfatase